MQKASPKKPGLWDMNIPLPDFAVYPLAWQKAAVFGSAAGPLLPTTLRTEAAFTPGWPGGKPAPT